MVNFPSQGVLAFCLMEILLFVRATHVAYPSLIPRGNFVRHVGAGQLPGLFHLFVDSDDNILVTNADTSTNQIMVFKADGTLVKNISIAGHAGTGGVCMDPEGRIITIDPKNGRILVI